MFSTPSSSSIFQLKNSNVNSISSIKKKQSQFIQQSARKDRQSRIKSQRYLHSIQIIDYKLSLNKFQQKLNHSYNSYTILNTLFQISENLNWRQYINKMQSLVSRFHNMISQNKAANIHDIVNIPNFQQKFNNLFLLKNQKLHKHLILLLKMLLAYNKKYNLLDEEKVSEKLASSSTYNNLNVISEVLWVMAQIQVSKQALVKLFKIQNLSIAIQRSNECLLPFLTILANFLASKSNNQAIIMQLITSNTFQKAFKLGINHSDINFVNETILVFNNSLCYSQKIRLIFLQSKDIINLILSKNCKQSQITKQIFTMLKITFTNENDQNSRIVNQHSIFNSSVIESKQSEMDFNSSIETVMN